MASEKRKYHCVVICKLLCLVVVVLFIGTISITQVFARNEQIGVSFPKDVADLTLWKSRAEAWAAKIKEDYATGSVEYKQAEVRYVEAKAAVDAWIAFLKTEVALSREISPSSELYKNTLNNAATNAYLFIEYAEGLYIEPRGKLSSFSEISEALTNAGIAIWREFRKVKEEGIARINKILDELKWQSFGKV